MQYKRRFVKVHRDFPEGCGVPSGYKPNADKISKQSNFENETSRIKDLVDDEKILESKGSDKDHQEAEVTGTRAMEDKEMKMISVKKISVKKRSERSDKDHQEEEVTGTEAMEDKNMKMSSVEMISAKKRSKGSDKDHQEEEVTGTGAMEDKEMKMSSVKKRMSSVKKRCLSSVVTSHRVLVLGLAAASTCPWGQATNKSTRQEKRRKKA